MKRIVAAVFVLSMIAAAIVFPETGIRGIFTASRAASEAPYEIPVLSLRYFPTTGNNLDASLTGSTMSLEGIRAYVDALQNDSLAALNEASAYHRYKNPSATPSLRYTLYEGKEFLAPVPLSAAFPPFIDHFKIFSDSSIGVSDICDYVDRSGVKEVWVWMYHYGDTVPIESNMAPRLGGAFGSEGYEDVSNSYRQDDLPRCAQTYTVYNYNYSRGLAEVLENHGHQLESLFGYADAILFWDTFVRPYGEAPPAVNRCGNVHIPPNASADYDWWNTTEVLSDCENWQPEGRGEARVVSCLSWSDSPDCRASVARKDANVGFKIWWMQNIPGMDNTLVYQGKLLRNWWDFVGDFDAAFAAGRSLVSSIPTEENPSVDPSYIPDGATIRAAGGIEVYIVKRAGTPSTGSGQAKKFKRLILNPTVFHSYGHLSWENVIEVAPAVLDAFTASNLVRAAGDYKVYLLYPFGDSGEKRWITTAEVFAAQGFDWDAVYEINAAERELYVTGADIRD